MALHPVVDADRRRAGGAVGPCEFDHRIRRNAAEARHALRWKFGGTAAQRIESGRVPVDVFVIDEILRDQHVHHAERKCGVGPRNERHVLVALFRGLAPIRVDGDELRAAALRFLRLAPEMQIGNDRIAAPDQDQPAVRELLDVRPHRRTDRRDPAGLAGSGADGPVEERRAEPVEETTIHRAGLQKPHRSRVGVRHDRLRALGRSGNRAEPGRDGVERLVPGNALEATLALPAHASHRVQHALRGIGALEVPCDLRAERSSRRRMVRRAPHLDRAAVLDRDQHRAGVGAIVRAGAANDGAAGKRVEGHGRKAGSGFAIIHALARCGPVGPARDHGTAVPVSSAGWRKGPMATCLR